MRHQRDAYAVSRHERIAEQYGRAILDWLAEQPEQLVINNLREGQEALGLDDVQFEMGLNWCKRHLYLNPLDVGLSLMAQKMIPNEDEIAEKKRERREISDPPPHLRDRHDLAAIVDDDEHEEDEIMEDTFTRFEGHRGRPRPDYPLRPPRRYADRFDTTDRSTQYPGMFSVLSLIVIGLLIGVLLDQFVRCDDEQRTTLVFAAIWAFSITRKQPLRLTILPLERSLARLTGKLP